MLHTAERFSPLLVPSRSVFIIYITPKHLFHHWTNYECDVHGSWALKKGFHPSRPIPPRPHYLCYPEPLFPALTQSSMRCLGVLRSAKRFFASSRSIPFRLRYNLYDPETLLPAPNQSSMCCPWILHTEERFSPFPSRPIPSRPHYLYYPETHLQALNQSWMCLGILRTAKRFLPLLVPIPSRPYYLYYHPSTKPIINVLSRDLEHWRKVFATPRSIGSRLHYLYYHPKASPST